MPITSKDFYTEHPPVRLIGTETECNIQLVEGTDQLLYISDEAIKAAGFSSIKGFLSNGMRLYPDVEHLEIDSAESPGPAAAVEADTAALEVLADIVKASKVPHSGLHAHSGTAIGSVECTSGRHENYLIPRSIVTNPRIDTILASFLCSTVFKMAGSVKDGFRLSQKAKDIGDPPVTRIVERRTQESNKPVAMIPPIKSDKDTIGSNEWARLEVRFADTCYSQTAKFLGFAATSLVLRLLEHQDKINLTSIDGFTFKRHAASAQLFSEDLTFSKTVDTVDGKTISAVDLQEILASYAALLAEKIELPRDEVEAITLWHEICDRLRAADLTKGEYEGLLTLLDFAPRHRYLTKRFEGDTLNSNNLKAVEANLTWDRILPIGGGLSYWKNFPSEFVNRSQIEKFKTQAPETRAKLRASLIKHRANRISSINWANVIFDSKDRSLGSPYRS